MKNLIPFVKQRGWNKGSFADSGQSHLVLDSNTLKLFFFSFLNLIHLKHFTSHQNISVGLNSGFLYKEFQHMEFLKKLKKFSLEDIKILNMPIDV